MFHFYFCRYDLGFILILTLMKRLFCSKSHNLYKKKNKINSIGFLFCKNVKNLINCKIYYYPDCNVNYCFRKTLYPYFMIIKIKNNFFYHQDFYQILVCQSYQIFQFLILTTGFSYCQHY